MMMNTRMILLKIPEVLTVKCGKKVDPKMDDDRRVYYKITALGQKALAAELERYREVMAVAKRLSPNSLIYGYGT